MHFSTFQQKILAFMLVVAIVAPAGLLTQPKKAEAACGLDGGGGGGGTPETNPNIQGPIDTSGMLPSMLPTPHQLAIQLFIKETPLAVSIPANLFKSAGASTLPQTSFDADALGSEAPLALDASQAWQAIQAGIATAQKAIELIGCIAGAVTSAATQSLSLKEYVLDPIAYALVNQIIADMLNDIQRWAISGFKGSPVFLTDPGKYFKGLADDMLGTFLNDIAGTNLCNLRWQPLIRIALDIDVGYRQRAQCSFSSIQGTFEQFTNDFSKGGWNSWIQLTTRPQNNPYGAYLLAAEEAARRIGTMPSGILPLKTLELSWGKGIISMTKCRVGENADGDCVDEAGNVDPFDTTITTPGNIIENAINSTLDMPNQRIVAADEINETIAAIMYGLLVKTFFSSGGFASADWSNLSSRVNTSGSLENLRTNITTFVDRFVASEAQYRRNKERSLAIVKEGETALNKLTVCYNDQIKLNNQYQNEIGQAAAIITNNPFTSFSSTTAATQIQNTLGIMTQQINPLIASFQNAIASSAGFAGEIGQIKTSVANATSTSEINDVNTLFSKIKTHWHDEVAAGEAQNEIDTTKKTIDPIVTQATADLTECLATRKSMRQFIISYGLTPVVPE